MAGGSWNRIGPSLGPNRSVRLNINASGSSGSSSRFMWVMKREAFQANRNPSGERCSQPSTMVSAGRR